MARDNAVSKPEIVLSICFKKNEWYDPVITPQTQKKQEILDRKKGRQ